jgi:hypothetical protein
MIPETGKQSLGFHLDMIGRDMLGRIIGGIDGRDEFLGRNRYKGGLGRGVFAKLFREENVNQIMEIRGRCRTSANLVSNG